MPEPSTPKATKAQLIAALHEADADINEGNEIRARLAAKLKEYEGVLGRIMDIHKPYVDSTRLMPADGFTPTITLRCTVCDTPEHHTWGNDNDEMWPCPTLQLFVNTSESPIEVAP